MKAPTHSSRFRLGVVMPLICGFLCFTLSTGALAGDPDDDWGLPVVSDGDDGDDSSSSGDSSGGGMGTSSNGALLDIQIGSEVVEFQPQDELGLLLLDRVGHSSTGYDQGVAAAESDVSSVDPGSPVKVQRLSDGLAMQGRVFVTLPYNGKGSLKGTIRSPVDAVKVRAFLTVDSLDSLDELLADPSGIPVGVSTVLPVGAVAVVNLNAFQKLVDSYGDVLDGTHVSVVVLSTDSGGMMHVSAARIPTTGGSMEVLFR